MGELTASQQAAVDCDTNLIIFAGPGSGKTSTSIKKSARILSDPERVLILTTFSVESARELEERLKREFERSGERFPTQRVRASTFDSLALNHLKTVGALRHKLLDPKKQQAMIRRLVWEGSISKDDAAESWVEKWQSTLDREPLRRQIETESPRALWLIEAYYEGLKSAGLVDLATIKRTCAEGIAKGILPPLRCTDLLIDESQDCDDLQLLIARTHAQLGVNTTLVGDDDQCIYEWRSATGYKGMTQFAKEAKAQIVRLGENFRSHAEIVQAAVRLISFNNPDRVDKQQVAVKGPGGTVGWVSLQNIEEQANWVAKDVPSLAPGTLDCAVIARRNAALDEVERALASHNIPYHRAGKSIWDRDDLSSYMAFMSFIAGGGIDGLMVALGFMRVSSDAIHAISRQLREDPSPFFTQSMNLPSIIVDEPNALKVVTDMSAASSLWRTQLSKGQIGSVISDTASTFVKWLRIADPPPPDEAFEPKRIQALRNCLAMAETALLNLKGSLASRIRLLLDSRKESPTPGVVRLMTMHSSKGLEFDHVYLVDCDERPDDIAMTRVAAERRVMYVGMTRARKYLRVLYSGHLPLFLKEANLQKA